MPRFMSTAEAAAVLGVSERRVRAILETGRVKGAFKVGGTWVIPVDRDGNPKITLNPPGRPAQ